MTDFRSQLSDLRRPRVLIRAARHGLADYRRERDLARIIPTGDTLSPSQTLPRLLHAEAMLEAGRRDGSLTYSFARHIDVMIALLAETSLTHRDTA